MSVTPRIGSRLAASAGAFGAVLRNPALRRVELAFLGFNLTEWAIWIAILVVAYGHGGSGEVALVAVLLHDVPRTASVAAITPVELLALDRHDFVEAVTGQPAAVEAAESVIHTHLDHAADERR